MVGQCGRTGGSLAARTLIGSLGRGTQRIEKYAIARNSIERRWRASARVLSRKAVCGQRQALRWSESYNFMKIISSVVMYEKYKQKKKDKK